MDDGVTHHLIEHHNWWHSLLWEYNSPFFTNISLSFKSNEFCLRLNSNFDIKISDMKNNNDKSPSISRWNISAWVSFKIFIKKIQIDCHWDTWQKKDIESIQEGKIHQLRVVYMTHPTLKMFDSSFLPVTVKWIKNVLVNRNISVIPLLIFYEHSKTIMFRVIGAVIYTIFTATFSWLSGSDSK